MKTEVEMIAEIISIVASALSGAILYLIRKYFKNAEKKACELEERQCKKDLLMLKSLRALRELTVANSVALSSGKSNGEVKKAQLEFEAVDQELNEFLLENAVKKMHNKK